MTMIIKLEAMTTLPTALEECLGMYRAASLAKKHDSQAEIPIVSCD